MNEGEFSRRQLLGATAVGITGPVFGQRRQRPYPISKRTAHSTVRTVDVSNVTSESVVLHGELTQLDQANATQVFFEFKQQTDTEWRSTHARTLHVPGTFRLVASNLDEGLGYDYRAVVRVGDRTVTGERRSFVTASEPLPNHIIIFGGSGSNVVNYEFEVGGTVGTSRESEGAPIEERYISFNSEDDIDGRRVSGAVAGGADAYQFSGELQNLAVDGDARVFVNGRETEPASSDVDRPSHLVVLGGSGNDVIQYEFAVTRGPIEPSEEGGDAPIEDRYVSFNGEDDISGTSASGAVAGGADAYRFPGELQNLAVDGDARVYLNGERVEPTENRGASFEPDVSFECHGVWVTAESYGQVTVFMADGTNQTFEGAYGGQMSFGYAGDVAGPFDENFETFHGPVERVSVANGDTEVTIQSDRDTSGCWDVGDFEFECSTVRTAFDDGFLWFADGTEKYYEYGAKGRLGSPGRALEGFEHVSGFRGFNPNDCSPTNGPATVIDCTELRVGASEFTMGTPAIRGVELVFTDGTRQTFGRPGSPSGDAAFTAPATFSGGGEHQGKVIRRALVSGGDPHFDLLVANSSANSCTPSTPTETTEATETTEPTETPESTETTEVETTEPAETTEIETTEPTETETTEATETETTEPTESIETTEPTEQETTEPTATTKSSLSAESESANESRGGAENAAIRDPTNREEMAITGLATAGGFGRLVQFLQSRKNGE